MRNPFLLLAAVLSSGLIAASASARSVVLHVANNGIDSIDCGAETTPCRTIGWTVGLAPVLSTVLVHPGIYGDVDGDGSLTSAGEENPVGGEILDIDRQVTITSAAGPGSTVLRCPGQAAGPSVVLISAPGASFGRKAYGLTLLDCQIAVEAADASVSGNRVIGLAQTAQTGIAARDFAGIKLQANHVIGWETGIAVETAESALVDRNVVAANSVGIDDEGTGTRISRNVVVGNTFQGVWLRGLSSGITGEAATVEKNSIIGNGKSSLTASRGGVLVEASEGITVQRNNIFANDEPRDNCGITIAASDPVNALGNFWGKASGPGSEPADQVCLLQPAQVDAAGFAATELKVKPLPLK